MVAATFEKAKTYVFAEPLVWDREVGGSNPLAPTTNINNLRLPALAAVFLVWPICGRTDGQLSNHVFALRHQNLRLPEKLRDLAFWPRRLHLPSFIPRGAERCASEARDSTHLCFTFQ